jgi:hypothetical protein
VDDEQAFRSLTLLVAVCEQALVELQGAASLADIPNLVGKIDAARDAAVEALAGLSNAGTVERLTRRAF